MMLQGVYMSIIIMKWRLTIRWSRPGMRGDLPAKLYDGDAEIAFDGSSPGG
jgi:hypothetical protein